LGVLPETLFGYLQQIRTDGEIWQHVAAIGSADGSTNDASGRLSCLNCSAGNGGARGVFDDAVNLRRLGPHRRRREKQPKRNPCYDPHLPSPTYFTELFADTIKSACKRQGPLTGH